jgi:hypothetical protein
MKKSTLLCFVTGLAMGFQVQAQIALNLQLPPAGLSIKPQLWNLSLVNTNQDQLMVWVEMVMTDASTNQQVLTGTSRMFSLGRGVKQLRPSDVMPVTYNTANPNYITDTRPDGFLPTGVYVVCYSVIKGGNDAHDKLAEECETVHIEPLSPPQLVLPSDNEQITLTRPLFTWLPPAPVQSGNKVLYDWVLVEVQATQSAANAVQQNIPVLSRQNVPFTSFQFPMAMPELDTAKLYAWRITAKTNGKPIANSEVWSFRIKNDRLSHSAATESGAFARLKSQEDGSYVVCDGVLRFQYDNEYNAGTVAVTITDLTAAKRTQLALDSSEYAVHYGSNYMQLNLKENRGLKNGHFYLMEIMNEKQQKWYLKFEYRKSKKG